MRDSSSLRDQEKGSLDGEAFSNHDEDGEEEQRISSSAMTVGGDLFSIGDGDKAMALTRGVLAPLQGIPKDLPYGGHEQHVSLPKYKKTEQRRDHLADPLLGDGEMLQVEVLLHH